MIQKRVLHQISIETLFLKRLGSLLKKLEIWNSLGLELFPKEIKFSVGIIKINVGTLSCHENANKHMFTKSIFKLC